MELKDYMIGIDPLVQRLGRDRWELTTKIYTQQENIKDTFIYAHLSESVKPPIKGEITEGKLRWRGVKIFQTPDGRVWLEQRGVKTSNTLKITTRVENGEVIIKAELIPS